MGMQKSKYVQLETDFARMAKFAEIIDQDLGDKNDGIADVYMKQTNDNKLFLRFCNAQEIAIKKDKFLNYKGKYLCMISNLKSKGFN